MNELNVETIIAKDPAQVTEPEKNFLTEHASELQDDVKTKFGITAKEEDADEDINVDDILNLKDEPDNGKKKEGEEDDDVSPDDEKIIEKVVNKKLEKLNTVEQRLFQNEAKADVKAFITANPEFAKFEDKILQAASNVKLRSVMPKIETIAYALAGKSLMKIGAQKERAAQKKVLETHTPNGGSSRPQGGNNTDWSKAPKEDYEKKRAEVLGYGGK